MWVEEDGRRALLKDQNGGAHGKEPLIEYATEFEGLRSRAASKLEALQNSGGAWAEEAAKAESLIQKMEACRRQVVVQLRLELSGVTQDARETWERRLEEWLRTISALRSTLESGREEQRRQQLHLPVPALQFGYEHRATMQATDLLDRSTARLEEAKRQAFDTEAIGQGVLSDLASQRESIEHVRDNMSTVSAELNAARRSIDRLIRTAQQNRMIQMAAALLLSVGLAFWGLMTLDLPLKWNFLLALALVLAVATAWYLCRRFQAKQRALRASVEEPASGFDFASF
eukprot:CAMPEP_0117509908 /NCGR_PEP_ID=MMETSP0784-20121206/27718_1 /TAXON_ID=39447 /ORGANISM="" /LENGTH=286 /DNA_ID=CAMNT_0005305531 /DNA_START=31 /DNA_END=891 /DNA_ORIENTATION=+